jgi:PTS system nitrogen regulatory IIA component
MTTVVAIPLTLERVAIDRQIGSKHEVLERICALLTDGVEELAAPAILDGLLERERLGSTGLGQGVALPHARFGTSGRVAGALLSLPGGVDFDSSDGAPVHLVFGLLVPEDATALHLGILARLASTFRDSRLIESLRDASSPEALYQRFIQGVEAPL